jgi:hypothetical protein
MNWEAIGAVGELLSAVVVVASVVYLGVQIRANTRVSQNEAYRDLTEVWKGFFNMQQNADNEVVLKALTNFEMLESHEKIQFDALMMALMVSVEISIEVADQSFVAAEQIDPTEMYVGRYFSYAGTLEWWRSGKFGCAPTVQKWIDARFTVADPGSDYWGIESPTSSKLGSSTTPDPASS